MGVILEKVSETKVLDVSQQSIAKYLSLEEVGGNCRSAAGIAGPFPRQTSISSTVRNRKHLDQLQGDAHVH